MPGQLNTASVTTVPPSSRGTRAPVALTTGMSAFRSAWRPTTIRGTRPFDAAVRM